jgi:peptidyl-prolyl cis-trans isomerase SurA
MRLSSVSLLSALSLLCMGPLPVASQAQSRLATEIRTPVEAPGQPQALDQIVAVVNNEVITRVELRNRLRIVETQLAAQKTALPPRDVLERQILERLIVERAQTQAARTSGLRIDDSQLDRAIARIAEQNRVTIQQLRDQLESEGTPFVRFREDVREEILIQRLREREVDSRVQVSESEIDSFIAGQSLSSNNGAPEEMDLAQILIRVAEQSTPEQIEQQRQRAEEVRKQLAAGADFGALAAKYSDAPDALTGGALGWRSTDRLPQLFVDALNGVRVGQLAPLVKSANGFHVLKLLGRRGADGKPAIDSPLQQTRARHILIRVTELVPSGVARTRLSEIRQRIESKSTSFEEMARQYSADGSATRGGDLGILYAGDTVPEFERAMDALAPGEISVPVESPFGWHLIQLIERKVADVSKDRQRVMARQILRERKTDEAYQDWLRQMRDRAYVDIRLDER